MKRESFPFMTMRQIVTGLDVARQPRRHRTSAEAFRAQSLKELKPHINERAIGLVLEEEKRRFMRQNQALERGRQKIQMTRLKLLATREKNQRLMALRHSLQKQRWQDTEVAAPLPAPQSGAARQAARRSLREIRVRRG
jgi:hypothetical protein